MRAYLLRRLLFILPTLLLVTMIVFISVRLIPGDVVQRMAWEQMGGPTRVSIGKGPSTQIYLITPAASLQPASTVSPCTVRLFAGE